MIKIPKKSRKKYQISVYAPLTLSGRKVFGKYRTQKQAEREFEKGLGTKFITGRVEKIPVGKKTKFSIFGKKFAIQL